jgi:hypothetical protein
MIPICDDDTLRAAARRAAGRSPAPSAAVIDSQSVRAADTVPKASQGRDSAKKVNGRKRHIAADTPGLLLAVVVTAARVQDRDGARLLWRLRAGHRRITLAWADAAYSRKLTDWAAATLRLPIGIVRKCNLRSATPPLGRRAHLRLAQQAPPLRPRLHHEAMIKWTMTAPVVRRLVRQPTSSPASRRRPGHRRMMRSGRLAPPTLASNCQPRKGGRYGRTRLARTHHPALGG